MKKNIIITLFSIIFCSNVLATSGLKIGFVSVEKILTLSPQVEAVNTAMMERFGGKKQELQALEIEIKSMQENYKRNELVMTENKLTALKTKLISKVQSFKQKEAALGQEVSVMRNHELSSLQKSVREIINNIAKKDKYDLILSEGVVFASEQVDITDDVLAEMKKVFKK